MYKLVVTSWENDDEYGQGGNLETKDRYFGSLSEVLERSNDRIDGIAFAIYERQTDYSWLLYFHSIEGWWKVKPQPFIANDGNNEGLNYDPY